MEAEPFRDLKQSEASLKSFKNWEPTLDMEKMCDMTEFGRPVDEPSSLVLNFLKPVRKVFWGDRKKSIAVV